MQNINLVQNNQDSQRKNSIEQQNQKIKDLEQQKQLAQQSHQASIPSRVIPKIQSKRSEKIEMVLHKMINVDPEMNKNDFLKEIDSIQRFVEEVRCEVTPDKNQLDIANAKSTNEQETFTKNYASQNYEKYKVTKEIVDFYNSNKLFNVIYQIAFILLGFLSRLINIIYIACTLFKSSGLKAGLVLFLITTSLINVVLIAQIIHKLQINLKTTKQHQYVTKYKVLYDILTVLFFSLTSEIKLCPLMFCLFIERTFEVIIKQELIDLANDQPDPDKKEKFKQKGTHVLFNDEDNQHQPQAPHKRSSNDKLINRQGTSFKINLDQINEKSKSDATNSIINNNKPHAINFSSNNISQMQEDQKKQQINIMSILQKPNIWVMFSSDKLYQNFTKFQSIVVIVFEIVPVLVIQYINTGLSNGLSIFSFILNILFIMLNLGTLCQICFKRLLPELIQFKKQIINILLNLDSKNKESLFDNTNFALQDFTDVYYFAKMREEQLQKTLYLNIKFDSIQLYTDEILCLLSTCIPKLISLQYLKFDFNGQMFLDIQFRFFCLTLQSLPFSPHTLELIMSDCEINTVKLIYLSQSLQNMSKIKKLVLDLWDNEITKEGIKQVCQSLERILNLEYLMINIGYNRLDDESVEKIGQSLFKLTQLKEIALLCWECNMKQCKSLAKALSRMQNLQRVEIDMGYNQIGSTGVQQISQALQMLPNISLLIWNLWNSNIQEEGVNHISQMITQLKKLTELVLYLEENKISPDTLKLITKSINQNKNILKLYLDIGQNEIEDEGVNLLAQLIRDNQQLKHIELFLEENQITKKGVETLYNAIIANINTITTLKLNLTFNKIGSEGQELLNNLKKLKKEFFITP